MVSSVGARYSLRIPETQATILITSNEEATADGMF